MSQTEPPTVAWVDVLNEREKQRRMWGDEHDDREHPDGQLADVAAFLAHSWSHFDAPEWGQVLWHKHRHDRRRQLIIAAALCIAEAERLDRAAAPVVLAPNEHNDHIARTCTQGREETDHE